MWRARARRNVQRAVRPLGPVDDLVRRVAPGRSFIDVGAIWDVHGRNAFLAEDEGASAVTALDITAETDEYRAEHERRGSKVRFVRGDLHDPDTIREAGLHDVVWCGGILYHVANPLVTIECLRQLTAETLVLISATIPEVPGVEHASVFWPHLPADARERYNRMYDATASRWSWGRSARNGGRAMRRPVARTPARPARVGLSTAFDPAQSYANWWWGLTPSAIGAMLQVGGFRVAETQTNGFHTRILAETA
jgi:methyltransferase family protein